jgi:cytidylate kinase
MMRERPVVAIDGPAGSGKTTVARMVARSLGYALVDTGAIYRCLALAARRGGIGDDQAGALASLARSLPLRFVETGQGQRVLLGDEDVTGAIREPAISQSASRVSAHPQVRESLLSLQRDLGRAGGVVLEGRDIGTVVFPDAEVKVFLRADPRIRAQRRTEELQATGKQVTLEETLHEMRERDRRDEAREVAPCRPAADAVIVDTGPLSIQEVVDRVVALVSACLKGSG